MYNLLTKLSTEISENMVFDTLTKKEDKNGVQETISISGENRSIAFIASKLYC